MATNRLEYKRVSAFETGSTGDIINYYNQVYKNEDFDIYAECINEYLSEDNKIKIY